jgi:hypothetical protein
MKEISYYVVREIFEKKAIDILETTYKYSKLPAHEQQTLQNPVLNSASETFSSGSGILSEPESLVVDGLCCDVGRDSICSVDRVGL